VTTHAVSNINPPRVIVEFTLIHAFVYNILNHLECLLDFDLHAPRSFVIGILDNRGGVEAPDLHCFKSGTVSKVLSQVNILLLLMVSPTYVI